MHRCLVNLQARTANELSVAKDDIVNIAQALNTFDDYVLVEHVGFSGLVPKRYTIALARYINIRSYLAISSSTRHSDTGLHIIAPRTRDDRPALGVPDAAPKKSRPAVPPRRPRLPTGDHTLHDLDATSTA